jgi:hypothetical protein
MLRLRPCMITPLSGPERLAPRRVAEPTAALCQRHAVGSGWATPTAILARRPVCQATVVTGYADGPDIWPSA